jgi:hypothetical protein
MGRYVSRGYGIEKFRASVVGWKLSADPPLEIFLVPPQEALSRQDALAAVIRMVEGVAHMRMADLEGRDAGMM